jgi:hypothetical protein
MVYETNRYAEQYLQTHEINRRSKSRQWKPTTKNLLAMSEDVVLAFTRKSVENNRKKTVMELEKSKNFLS